MICWKWKYDERSHLGRLPKARCYSCNSYHSSITIITIISYHDIESFSPTDGRPDNLDWNHPWNSRKMSLLRVAFETAKIYRLSKMDIIIVQCIQNLALLAVYNYKIGPNNRTVLKFNTKGVCVCMVYNNVHEWLEWVQYWSEVLGFRTWTIRNDLGSVWMKYNNSFLVLLLFRPSDTSL